MTLSQRLDEIGYFNLILDETKKKYLMKTIDNPDKFYNEGKNWLLFHNDRYISSECNLDNYDDSGCTSDYRSFEVYPSDMYRGNLEAYLNSAKVVFEKNDLKFDWNDENLEMEGRYVYYHSVKINGMEYAIYSAKIQGYIKDYPLYEYLMNFKEILNKVAKSQTDKYKVVLLSAPDAFVYLILLDYNMIEKFKVIVENLDNVLEE